MEASQVVSEEQERLARELADVVGDDEDVTVGGRTFRITSDEDVVFEQYGYIQKACADAGMGQEMFESMRPAIEAIEGDAEVPDHLYRQIAETVLMRAFENRAYLDVCAGTLVEVGTEWTLASATENREYFARAKKADIPGLHQVIVQAVLGFFISGLNSMMTSPSSGNGRQVSPIEGMSLRPKDPPGDTDSETSEK